MKLPFVLYRIDRNNVRKELYLSHLEAGIPELTRDAGEAMRFKSLEAAYGYAKYYHRLQCYRAGRR